MGTSEIQHCAKYTLQNDKPDVVILNTGHNDIRNYKPEIIAEKIINLAALCKTSGVNDVIISAITPYQGFQTKVDHVNDILLNKQQEYNYRFIKNDNITATADLWRDKIHLNDDGLSKLVNNFIFMLNNDLVGIC